MRQLRLQLRQLSVVQIAIFLLIIGVFLGVLSANLLQDKYTNQLRTYEEKVFPEITTGDIDYSGFFCYVLSKNFNEFIVFWLLSITILGIPYMAFKISSFGFFAGFFISALTLQYGFKGIVLILAYFFPQGLLYLPIAFVSLYKGYSMCKTIYQTNRTSVGGFLHPIKTNLIVILVLAILLLVASFLEAYPGAYLLKKALGLFI